MNCPACFTETLEPYRDEEVALEIDACSKCRGVWFDPQELSTFLTSEPLKEQFLVEARTPDERPRRVAHVLDIVRRNCPRDRMVMDQFVFAGVTLDRCPQCRGLWFDHGEVRLVVERHKKGLGGHPEIAAELDSVLGEPAPTEPEPRRMLPGLLSFVRLLHSRS